MQAEAERREEEKEEAGRQARRRLASLERQKAQERAQLERHRRMKQLRDEISELERGLPSMSESPIAQYSLGHSGKLTMYSNWLMYESLKKTLRLPFYCLGGAERYFLGDHMMVWYGGDGTFEGSRSCLWETKSGRLDLRGRSRVIKEVFDKVQSALAQWKGTPEGRRVAEIEAKAKKNKKELDGLARARRKLL